ncbi:MAG: phosphatidylserine/phosphatidylglycerophosphate/cardiolipin synthase family protein [Verrucomicrobiota bacterium]|jgi:cardiolipin synthase
MRKHRTFSKCLAGLWLILLLGGCVIPGPRSRYLQQIEPETVTNLIAYRFGGNVEIRIPLRGKDAFAHASWAVPDGGATNYQHRFAELTFDKEKWTARKSVATKTNRLAVRDPRQWRQLLQQLFAGLMPAQPGHGVLLLAQNQEIVVFRDKAGRLGTVKLELKPPEVTVDRSYNDDDFARETIALLSAEAGAAAPPSCLFVTGEDPAFVLVDPLQRLVVFLNSPADPETEEVPIRFAVRALNSLVIRSLAVSAIKNPVTLVSRGFWHLGNSGAAAISFGSGIPDTPPPPLATGAPMDLADWENELDRVVPARRHQGRVDLFIDGESFFPAFIQSVQEATRSVDVQVYIFDTDDYAVEIADLLKRRSVAVKVKVLMDDMGSLFAAQAPPPSPLPAGFERPADIRSYLRAGSRVRVRASANPWLTVDHRKCIIIDGRQAYIGGMNIGRQYRYEWHDMMIGLTGPIVGRLEKDYREAWAHAGPLGDFAYAWEWVFGRVAPRKHQITHPIDIRPLRTSTGKMEIYLAQLQAIERARRYVYIENAYFGDDTILRALIRARQRGVDVRVIFPSKNDSGAMQVNNLVMANDLVRSGVRVYSYPGMTHVKAAIYDGWACVGSANFDKMSLRIGQELDVAFSDPATVERLKTELFERDFQRSREVKTVESLSWFDSVIKAFTDQL